MTKRIFLVNYALLILLLSLISISFLKAQSPLPPFARYKVIPNPEKEVVTVEAQIELQNVTPYIKDFGQLQSISWLVGGKEIAVKSERLKDIIIFSQVPSSGKAEIIYTIKFMTQLDNKTRPQDIHLFGGPDFLFVCEGLFLGLNGKEGGLVEVQWELPEGWKLGLGRTGLQLFHDTQERFWVAGRLKHTEERKVGNALLQIAVLEIPPNQDINWLVNSIAAVFQYAWQTIGPLEDQDYGIAIFPMGIMPQPGWAKWRSCFASTSPMVPPHEILHFWRSNTPAWFREGVLEYLSKKIMVRCGLMNEEMLQLWLRTRLIVHATLVKKQGTIKTLAESSTELERGTGGEDIYNLMPVLAYKLDKEIQKHNPKSSLDDVYSAACRKPLWQQVDVVALTKETTGYDPKPLFDKYFYAKVEKPEELLN